MKLIHFIVLHSQVIRLRRLLAMQRVLQQQQSSSELMVIGAGLMRTGTNSQMKALEILYGSRCYHMEVILKERRHHFKLWYQATMNGLTKELAYEIFDGFRLTTDFPAAHFYEELMEIYPNAKFVLSVRDPKQWVASVRGTVLMMSKALNSMLPPVRWLMGLTYLSPVIELILKRRLGFEFNMTDEEMIQVFNRHTEAVKRVIPEERLLVFRVSDGWEPLCKFLGLPVPEQPFPNVNDTEHFQRRTRFIRATGAVLNVAFCAAVGSAVWFGAKSCLRRWG